MYAKILVIWSKLQLWQPYNEVNQIYQLFFKNQLQRLAEAHRIKIKTRLATALFRSGSTTISLPVDVQADDDRSILLRLTTRHTLGVVGITLGQVFRVDRVCVCSNSPTTTLKGSPELPGLGLFSFE